MNVTATYLVHRQQETKLQWQIEHPRFLCLCFTGLLHSVLSEDYISVYETHLGWTTDYGHTKAKYQILCSPNKYLVCGYKGLVFCRNNG